MSVIKQGPFQQELKDALSNFLSEQKDFFPADEILRIDLHCHDHNSDVPDELIGRILNVPETWLPTKNLLKTLYKNNADVITVTNHNNARSCFELINKGVDVLVGAEFSCTVPDFNIGIHVLTYGFSKEQELVLNKLRRNVYQFLQYTKLHDLPTIWAHPLYHYNVKGVPTNDFFRKLVLLFERFEVLNGQRDTWQNMLVKEWLSSVTPEQIDRDADFFNIDLSLYCSDPYKKSFSGGSDSHMGIFSGQTGTYLHVPNLSERLKSEKPSSLALEAIKKGRMAPYGTHQNAEKLTVAFLDYVCQIALFREDPGLFRVLLHKGTVTQKLEALAVSNLFSELSRDKKSMRFVALFHDCLTGKVPSKSKRILLSKEYRPIFDDAVSIAKAHALEPSQMIQEINDCLNRMISSLNKILYKRLDKKVVAWISGNKKTEFKWDEIVRNLEIPSDFRLLMGSYSKKKKGEIQTFIDDLSFPFFTSSILLGAHFTSAKVMYNTRPLLNEFSKSIGKFEHPKRMLWLTDTFDDKNGVSGVLAEFHKEIKRRNLPIDILVCSNSVKSDDHLIVVKPQAVYEFPFYKEQSVRIPDVNQIHHLFLANEYDRIMCSTEGFMGVIGLYLKNAYSVEANFYMHTDWIMFARKNMALDIHNINRVRRFLRFYYNGYDRLFVLNTDHKKWLNSKDMDFSDDKVKLTAHWNSPVFTPRIKTKKAVFGISENTPIILYVGRLSPEKGLNDLVDIYPQVKNNLKKAKFVFVGEGPLEANLKKRLTDAIFIGWKSQEELADIYSAADVLVLPSKFDTFSCVVLEAFSCELPVIAYNSKGPKDIIQHGENGYLVTGKNELCQSIISFFDADENGIHSRRKAARLRSLDYQKEAIVDQLLLDVGF